MTLSKVLVRSRTEKWNRHAGTWVEHNGDSVYIDNGIIDDIRALWDAGIDTFTSCEGGDEWRYVMLSTQDPAAIGRAIAILGWVVTIKLDTRGYTHMRDQ